MLPFRPLLDGSALQTSWKAAATCCPAVWSIQAAVGAQQGRRIQHPAFAAPLERSQVTGALPMLSLAPAHAGVGGGGGGGGLPLLPPLLLSDALLGSGDDWGNGGCPPGEGGDGDEGGELLLPEVLPLPPPDDGADVTASPPPVAMLVTGLAAVPAAMALKNAKDLRQGSVQRTFSCVGYVVDMVTRRSSSSRKACCMAMTQLQRLILSSKAVYDEIERWNR